MTHLGLLQATRTADTEVFYMAGRQLGALAVKLQQAGWAADTPVLVLSRAGWPDALASQHQVATLHEAEAAHAGRPAVVTVGAGARPVASAPDDDHADLQAPFTDKTLAPDCPPAKLPGCPA
jgi:uroporphyrin-III C-methyltransferase